MKKNDHYNQNSAPQRKVVENSFTYIRKAVLSCEANVCDNVASSFTIVDYGSSQGANSIAAIEQILSNLTEKYPTKPLENVLVIFNDQPTNDWTTLFKTIEKYFMNHDYRHVTTLASGKSFYEQIMPSNSVHFAYASTASHWLSRKPCNISNQWAISAQEVKPEEFQLWKQQAYDDYKLFLQQRSKELKKGGVLLCAGPAFVEGHRLVHLHQTLYNSVVAILRSDEVLNFNVVNYHRTLDELIDENILKETNFEVITADLVETEQPSYADFKNGKITLDEFGKKFAGYVRSWSETSLINALDANRDEQDKAMVIKEVYSEVERQAKSTESLKLLELNRVYSYFVILRKI